METTDGAQTRSQPKAVDAVVRQRYPDGIERMMGDVYRQCHVTTNKPLVTGK